MRTSWRALFLEPIDESIQSELNSRKSSLSSKNRLTNLNFPFKKTAWVKLLSNAQIPEPIDYRGETIQPADFRYRFQLFNGVVKNSISSQQFELESTSEASFRSDLRNTPSPGITSVNINQAGRLGSVRKAIVSFTLHHEDDLAVYERLYMIPGISVILEWGWSIYSQGYLPDFDTSEEYYTEIVNKIYGDGAGNYDAMLGIITGFNYTINQYGGYECTVNLMSPSFMTSNLPMKTSYFNFQRVYQGSNNGEGVSDFFGLREFMTNSGGTKDYSIKFDNDSLDFFADSLNLSRPKSWVEEGESPNETSYNGIYPVSDQLLNLPPGSFESTWTGHWYGFQTRFGHNSNSEVTYVSWRWIEDVLLRMLALIGPQSGRPELFCSSLIPSVDSQTGDIIPNQFESVRIKNVPGLISLDPKVCILPGQQNEIFDRQDFKTITQKIYQDWVNEELDPSTAPLYDDSVKKRKVWTPGSIKTGELTYEGKKIRVIDSSPIDSFGDGNSNFGFLRNILVNLDMVEEVLNSVNLETGDRSIRVFLNQILHNISIACGGIWDFQIQDNPYVKGLSIIDLNSPPDSTFLSSLNSTNQNDRFSFCYDFEAAVSNSLVRDISISSKLPNSFQTVAFIGSSTRLSNDPNNGVQDSYPFTLYSGNITDRLYEITNINQLTGNNLTIKEHYFKSIWFSLGNDDDMESKQSSISSLQKWITGETTQNYEVYAPIYPFDISVTLDGISGIFMGNCFTSKQILPYRYRDNVVFQTTQVNHTIQGSDWSTGLTGIMRLYNQPIDNR